jgi:RNA polymerase sigma-70 factor (ECF subfamily)
MTLPDQDRNSLPPNAAQFVTPHWSVVLAAGGGDSPAAQQALERLCQTYWYPLYAYVRRQGVSPDDAADLVQGFFGSVIEKKSLAQVDPSERKFRAFLLACLKHFLSDARDSQRAQKRGGGKTIVSLDALDAEERYRREPAETLSPDKLYDRQWAFTVLDRARVRLRQEFEADGKGELYEYLKLLESGAEKNLTQAEVGRRMNTTESAIKNAALRFRRRRGELIREEIAPTVSGVSEIDEECRYLIELVSG